jgi:hypothetical protein
METIEPGTTGLRSPTRPARKLTTRQVCARYGNVCDRTVHRWGGDPELHFPKPMRVNRRLYYDEDELDEFDRRQTSRSGEAA